MIKSIVVTNHLNQSVTLSLTDPWDTGLIITQITGLGPPKAAINSTDLAMGDGAAYNSARIDKRNIVFNFRLAEVMEPDGQHIKKTIEEVRLDTYRYFPLKKHVKMLFETDTRTATIEGYIESNEPDIFNEKETAQVSIVCPDPFFYAYSKTANLNSVEPMFGFPFCNNDPVEPMLTVGEIIFNVGQNVYYKGDAECGVILNIHAIGTVKPMTIINNNSLEQMVINTSKIGAITGGENYLISGDDLVVSSMSGNVYCRLIRGGVTYNALSCIPKTSDWLHLYRGDNIFSYEAEDETTTNVLVSIDGYNLYTGV